MKKITLILVFFALNMVNAQQKNLIKASPLGFLLGSYSLGYERAIADNQSVQLDLNSTNIDILGIKVDGGGVGFSYRYYFQNKKDAFEGWYLSPAIGYASLDFSFANGVDGEITYNGATISADGTIETSVFGLSALGGYQWNWNPFTLELFVGPVISSISISDDTINADSTSGVGFTGGFTMGFAF